MISNALLKFNQTSYSCAGPNIALEAETAGPFKQKDGQFNHLVNPKFTRYTGWRPMQKSFFVATGLVHSLEPLRYRAFTDAEGLSDSAVFPALLFKLVSGDILASRLV
jgi:hypothetical protein